MSRLPFGLSRRPFSSTPDPAGLVGVGGMSEAIPDLERCAQNGQGIGILTAPAGLGKTILCHKLAEILQKQFAVVFLPNSNFPTRRSLLQAILYEMGHPYLRFGEQELRLELTSAVRDLPPEREGLVLIVDEAHLLHQRLLEELRTATHLVQDGEMLVRLILSGQLDLEERLVKKDMAALNQRIVCHVSLASLTMTESEEYLKSRLKWAGGELARIFEPVAVRMICQASDGNPRCLNQLADLSMVLADAENAPRLSADHVMAALEELKQLPLHWNHVEAPRQATAASSPVKSHGPGSFVESSEEIDAQTAVIEFGGPDEENEQIIATEQSDTPAEVRCDDTPLIVEPGNDESLETAWSSEIELSWDVDPSDEEVADSDVFAAEDLGSIGVEREIFPRSSTGEFSEEIVHDRVTELQKGNPVEATCSKGETAPSEDPVEALRAEEDAFATPPASSACPELTLVEPIPPASQEWQPEDLVLPENVPTNPDPSATIDEVAPLIEIALGEAEPPAKTTGPVFDCPDDSEPMVVPGSTLENLLADVSVDCYSEIKCHPADADCFVIDPCETSRVELEELIAQTVLDTYSDLKPLIWDSAECDSAGETLPAGQGEEPIRDPGDAAPFEALQASLREAVEAVEAVEAETAESVEPPEIVAGQAAPEYDIVMPDDGEDPCETESLTPDSLQTKSTDSCTPPRPYKNLFSKIRRQEQK